MSNLSRAAFRPVFTKEFIKPAKIPTFQPAIQTSVPTGKIISYLGPEEESDEDVKKNLAAFIGHKQQFPRFKKEYIALADRIAQFQRDNRNRIEPPLQDKTLAQTRADVEKFKAHLFGNGRSPFGNDHLKAKAYGAVKRMLHEYEHKLLDEKIPIQQRLDTIVNVSDALRKCADGIEDELTLAFHALSQPAKGVKRMAYWHKEKMVDNLVANFISRHHAKYTEKRRGNEKHFRAPYFNYLAPDLGLKERRDKFMTIALPHITPELLEECKKYVFENMGVEYLASEMAKTYLGKLRDELDEHLIDPSRPDDKAGKIDVTQPIPPEKMAAVLKRIKKFTPSLQEDFGIMPAGQYLEEVEPGIFRLRETSQVMEKEIVDRLEEEELVHHDGLFPLGEIDDGELTQLGNILLIRHQGIGRDEGEREARTYFDDLKVEQLLETSPETIYSDLLENKKVQPDEAVARLQSIALHIVNSAAREGIKQLREAWLQEFVSVYREQASSNKSSDKSSDKSPDKSSDKSSDKSPDKEWITPVTMLAAMFNCPKTLQALKDAGADLQAAHAEVISAAQNGHTDVLKILIDDGAGIHVKGPKGVIATQFAARNGDAEALRVLIKAGADIHGQGRKGITAAMLATQRGDPEALGVLIDNRADINVKDHQGTTAVMFAAYIGHLDVLKVLIAVEANINVKNNRGFTAAMMAAQNGHAEALKVLIDAEADINVQNDRGFTAAMMAVKKRHPEALKVLIDAGADIHVKNEEGDTAAIIAAKIGNAEALRVLIAAGADVRPIVKMFSPQGVMTFFYTSRLNKHVGMRQRIEIVNTIAPHLDKQMRKELLENINQSHTVSRSLMEKLRNEARKNSPAYEALKRDDPELYGVFEEMKQRLT